MKCIALSLSSLLLCLIGLSAAGMNPPAGPAPKVANFSTTWYPLKVKNRWVYRVLDLKDKDGAAGKFDEKKRRFPKTEVEVDREEIYERVVKKDDLGKGIVEKFAGFILKSTSEGKITYDHVVVMENGVFRANVAGTPVTPPLLFLKIPPSESWECNSRSGNVDIKGTFTSRAEKVQVPAGAFATIAVSLRDGPVNHRRIEIDYWFAENVGMVKQRVKSKNSEIVLELESFQKAN